MCSSFLRYLLNSFLVNRSTDEDEDEGDDTLPWPYLPEEIIIDNILPRLPIKGILRCKQVCKAWRHLIEGSDQFSMSKSKASYLLTQLKRSKRHYGICEFDGKDGGCTTTVSHLGFVRGGGDTELFIHSSANGVLFLVEEGISYAKLFICNPITREYTELPPPPPPPYQYHSPRVSGFGASKVSGQYKIVKIYGDRLFTDTCCQVYTVGREGRWRSVAVPPDYSYILFGGRGVYSNGNLHWLISSSGSYSDSMMRCFDLETEVFMDFHVPPHRLGQVSDLDGRLCLSGSSDDHDLVIWFLNKHGDGEEKSWTKEFIIKDPPRAFYPLKLFKDDGDILLEVVPPSRHLFYLYSNKTKTIQEYHGKGLRKPATNVVIAYTPTFLSLKTMGIQDSDVRSF